MNRAFMYLSALVGIGGMVYLAGLGQAQQPGVAPPAATPTSGSRPTIAVFNMAAVMRDYDKAKYQVYILNKSRMERSTGLVAMKGQYIKIEQDLRSGKIGDPGLKDKAERDKLDIARKLEDEERRVSKELNDEASKIISKLYDEIKTVVDKTAEMNAYHIVFAYPDAVTAEDQTNPYMKELKLKPPAAQPFFIAKQVDITGVVIQTLNAWYPPLDAHNQKIDVNKLPPLDPPAQPGTANPGAPPVGAVPPGAPQPQR